MDTLFCLTRSGFGSMGAKTVIVVIHQPRLSVFELFDRCVVFGVGNDSVGRVFDAGPRKMVAARLLRRFLATGLGDQPPNVADVLLDVVTAATPEETETAAVVHTDRWVSGKWSSTAPGAGEAGANLAQWKGTTYQDRFWRWPSRRPGSALPMSRLLSRRFWLD